MKPFFKHFHERDVGRANQAGALERTCVPKYKFERTIEIHLKDTRIRPATEIRSLLHYLHQHLVHKHRAFYLIPASEVGLLDFPKWHVTAQTGGLQGDYEDFVECMPSWDSWPSACHLGTLAEPA